MGEEQQPAAEESRGVELRRRLKLAALATLAAGPVLIDGAAALIDRRRAARDAERNERADAFVELIGFGFHGEVPGGPVVFSTPAVKEHVRHRLGELWKSLPEERRRTWDSLPASKQALERAYREAAGNPQVVERTREIVRGMFPVLQEQYDRQKAAEELEREQARARAEAEAYRRSEEARAREWRRARPRSAPPTPKVPPYVADALGGAIRIWEADRHRNFQRQLDVLTGRRSP